MLNHGIFYLIYIQILTAKDTKLAQSTQRKITTTEASEVRTASRDSEKSFKVSSFNFHISYFKILSGRAPACRTGREPRPVSKELLNYFCLILDLVMLELTKM